MGGLVEMLQRHRLAEKGLKEVNEVIQLCSFYFLPLSSGCSVMLDSF